MGSVLGVHSRVKGQYAAAALLQNTESTRPHLGKAPHLCAGFCKDFVCLKKLTKVP